MFVIEAWHFLKAVCLIRTYLQKHLQKRMFINILYSNISEERTQSFEVNEKLSGVEHRSVIWEVDMLLCVWCSCIIQEIAPASARLPLTSRSNRWKEAYSWYQMLQWLCACQITCCKLVNCCGKCAMTRCGTAGKYDSQYIFFYRSFISVHLRYTAI